MTVLILAAQKIIPFRASGCCAAARRTFAVFNRRGFLSMGLCAVIVGSSAAYLFALAALFHAGLEMQAVSRKITRMQEDILKNEIALQESDAGFASAHKDILDGMEKISSVTYIPREYAAALAHPSAIGQ